MIGTIIGIIIISGFIYINLNEDPGGCDFKCFDCSFPECSPKEKATRS